jgi:hypothetical protein
MAWNKLRALYIDDDIVAKAQAVQAYAIEHRETLRQIAARMSTNAPGPGNDENHVLFIPAGYRVVYSIEQQQVGWCQHISISVDTPGMWPSQESVSRILKELFGILWNPNPKRPNQSQPDAAIQLWQEESAQAVNFLFPYKFPGGVPAAPESATN